MKDNKDVLIKKIVAAEWDMFQGVNNVSGQRASCQEDPKTFDIMRSSQFKSWDEEVLKSYLNDLKSAKKDGRNLLTEKYARMMASTAPSEYAKIKHLLPPVDPETPKLIDQILEIVYEWEKELVEKYPNIIKRGRSLESMDDNLYSTSKMTYYQGELSTYSLNTLRLLYESVKKMKSQHINGSKVILEETSKRYGYHSIDEANGILS
jgi:hypothetical protein